MKEKTLIGLFSDDHLEYDIEREERAPHQPTLEEMTEVAIKKLSQNPNGYYLFVEAGKIGKGFNLKLSRLWKSSIKISYFMTIYFL